jgi:hypothetical protein
LIGATLLDQLRDQVCIGTLSYLLLFFHMLAIME